MSLIEIEKQVKPLSRDEKWQLIRFLQDLLMQEEGVDIQSLSQSNHPYPLFTPVGLEKGANKLQKYIEEGRL